MLFLPLVLTPIARLRRRFVRTSHVSEETSETVSSFTPRDAPPQSKKSNNFSHPELETFYATTGFLLRPYAEGTSARAVRFFLSQPMISFSRYRCYFWELWSFEDKTSQFSASATDPDVLSHSDEFYINELYL